MEARYPWDFIVATSEEPYGRLTSLGNQLVEIHVNLREQLSQLREDLDVYLYPQSGAGIAPADGVRPIGGVAAAAGLPAVDGVPVAGGVRAARELPAAGVRAAGGGRQRRDLRTHCLAFCTALDRHHTGEDAGAFRVLAEREPALRPVLAELAEDHRIVAAILRRLDELLNAAVTGDADDVDPATLAGELDSLSALLESHFNYEEKKLFAALNALDERTATAQELFGLPAPTPY